MSDYDEGYRAGLQKSRDVARPHIEELEAKLAKAEQLINELRYAWSVRDLTQADFDKARAELKGQDDGNDT